MTVYYIAAVPQVRVFFTKPRMRLLPLPAYATQYILPGKLRSHLIGFTRIYLRCQLKLFTRAHSAQLQRLLAYCRRVR